MSQQSVEMADVSSDGKNSQTVKTSPLNEGFDAFVQGSMQKWHTKGLAIAVIDGDETWSEGYGIAALPDVPVTPSTLFCTANTTKSFTAAAASLLVDDEKYSPRIEWTTPLAQLIPGDFAVQDEYASAHITLEDALSHRTGLPGHMLMIGREESVRDIVRSLRHLPMNREIRTTFQYSNAMFIAVSHAIESVTGQWLGDFLRERIWHPLGMSSTFFSLNHAREHVFRNPGVNLADPFAWDKNIDGDVALPHCTATLSGAGGIISNVLDYAKYVRSMIRRVGPLSGIGYEEVFKPRSIMLDDTHPVLKLQRMYSLGWMSSVYRGERVFFHPGGLNGMASEMIFLPERDWGVVVLCNGLYGGVLEIAWKLIDDLLGVPQEYRVNIFERQVGPPSSVGSSLMIDLSRKQQLLASAREERWKKRQALSTSSPGIVPYPHLTGYSGTYKHPTYPALVIRARPGGATDLHIDMSGGMDVQMELIHVTGEFYLAEIYENVYEEDPAALVMSEFYVDVNNIAARFGIMIDYKNMPDTMIWFERSE